MLVYTPLYTPERLSCYTYTVPPLGVVVVLLLVGLLCLYLAKQRQTMPAPRVLACNGNGHILPKRSQVGAGQRGSRATREQGSEGAG